MRRRNIDADMRILSTLTVAKLEEASRQEQNNEPVADPAARLLQQHIHGTGGRVHGSDQMRYSLRSQI